MTFLRIVLIIVAVLAAWIAVLIGRGDFERYLSWRSLSATKVSTSVQLYLDEKVEDSDQVVAICFYALDCSSGRARLRLVSTPAQYDFDALKQRIWKRRFDRVCEGVSANLGLHLLRALNSRRDDHSDNAIWSFVGDDFHSSLGGHWSIPGAFSEEPWKRCSIEDAAFHVKDGKIYGAEQNQPAETGG